MRSYQCIVKVIPNSRKMSVPADDYKVIPNSRELSTPRDYYKLTPNSRKLSPPEDDNKVIPNFRKLSTPEDDHKAISINKIGIKQCQIRITNKINEYNCKRCK